MRFRTAVEFHCAVITINSIMFITTREINNKNQNHNDKYNAIDGNLRELGSPNPV